MNAITINYGARETAPTLLKQKAAELGLSPEQLVRRFVARQLSELMGNNNEQEPLPGASWEEYLTRNGVLKEAEVSQ